MKAIVPKPLQEPMKWVFREAVINFSLVVRACRVMEMGGIRQRFQPKEHNVLVLG